MTNNNSTLSTFSVFYMTNNTSTLSRVTAAAPWCASRCRGPGTRPASSPSASGENNRNRNRSDLMKIVSDMNVRRCGEQDVPAVYADVASASCWIDTQVR